MGSAKEQFDSKGREKIQCNLCGNWYHRLEIHLKSHSMTVAQYQDRFPGAPTISEAARRSASKAATKTPEPTTPVDENEPFKFGVARLKQVNDKDLTRQQKAEVPIHDINWLPGAREMEHMETIGVGVEDRDNVFVFGPTGGGKTTIIKQMAAILNQPIMRFQFSNKISIEDFVGQMEVVVEDGKQVTRWKDGAFTRAWRENYWIIFDEISKATPGILMRVQGCLEGDDLVLIENGGEVVKRGDRTVIFATDNTNGRGDESGMYVSSNVMDEATLDRFGTVVKFDYPDKDTEAEILVKKSGISKDVAGRMVAVALKVRDAFNREECYCTFSTRRLISWARKSKRFGDNLKAARVAVTNKLSDDDAKFVDGIIQRHFGGAV